MEGDIFRIGMYLEDIKEIIDKNVCEQISPTHLSSTPTSMTKMLHVKPLCMSTPSPPPPPSLHEVINSLTYASPNLTHLPSSTFLSQSIAWSTVKYFSRCWTDCCDYKMSYKMSQQQLDVRKAISFIKIKGAS